MQQITIHYASKAIIRYTTTVICESWKKRSASLLDRRLCGRRRARQSRMKCRKVCWDRRPSPPRPTPQQSDSSVSSRRRTGQLRWWRADYQRLQSLRWADWLGRRKRPSKRPDRLGGSRTIGSRCRSSQRTATWCVSLRPSVRPSGRKPSDQLGERALHRRPCCSFHGFLCRRAGNTVRLLRLHRFYKLVFLSFPPASLLHSTTHAVVVLGDLVKRLSAVQRILLQLLYNTLIPSYIMPQSSCEKDITFRFATGKKPNEHSRTRVWWRRDTSAFDREHITQQLHMAWRERE